MKYQDTDSAQGLRLIAKRWGDNSLFNSKMDIATVYNFEVEDDHTYFVGEQGLWVHQ
ncbi:HINT domain-containing protein [Acinetobacter sp. CFCC 10889]|uniref:HINT domain-containing protein n=1 Tax=Acinetobacter sp. CFCC 10889 TaxID=1775557 RepID=UPI001D197030|nr:HINT domain-containing protein [Acinetobacter sp. CFCC 10889]